MKIGIDVSQLAHTNTGVANYLKDLVEHMIEVDKENEYVLFFSSLRKKLDGQFVANISKLGGKRLTIKTFSLPPSLIEILWNRLHIVPIDWFIGKTDVFLSSDWVQPPTSAKKATILYDLIVYKFPQETHNEWHIDMRKLQIKSNIVASQKRRLQHVAKECDAILCISESTKRDAADILHIPEEKLHVIRPGLTL